MIKDMENVELAMVIRELIEEKKNAEKDMKAAQRLFDEHTARFKSLEKAVYVLQHEDMAKPEKDNSEVGLAGIQCKAKAFKRAYEDWK